MSWYDNSKRNSDVATSWVSIVRHGCTIPFIAGRDVALANHGTPCLPPCLPSSLPASCRCASASTLGAKRGVYRTSVALSVLAHEALLQPLLS